MELGGTARRYRALQPSRLRGCRIDIANIDIREYARVTITSKCRGPKYSGPLNHRLRMLLSLNYISNVII